MFSCVWLHCKIFFEKYFLVIGKEVEKEEGRGKTQKNPDIPRRTRHDLAIDGTISDCDRRKRCFARSRSWRCDLVKRRSRTVLRARSATRSRVLCLFRSPFARPQFRKSFEVKIGTEMNFCGQRYYFTVNWKWFPENLIFQTNQTAYFTENDFLKPFSPKTNTALVTKYFVGKCSKIL